MTDHIEVEIDRALKQLLPHCQCIHKLSSEDSKNLVSVVIETFVDSADRVWWWEGLVGSHRTFENVEGDLAWISGLGNLDVPEFYMLTMPDAGDPCVAYSGSLSAFIALLGACSYFEFALVPFTKKWLACENHHGQVFIVEPTGVSE